MDFCKLVLLNMHGHNLSMQWPTCPVSSPIYLQMHKSKISKTSTLGGEDQVSARKRS